MMSDSLVNKIVIRETVKEDYHFGLKECLEQFAKLANYDSFCQQFRYRQECGILTFVAEDDLRHVCGTASLFVEPKFIHEGACVGHIEDVAVYPGYQGNGVGWLIVQHLLELCRHSGCYKAILDCHEHTAGFYEKLGFYRHELCMRMDFDGGPLELSVGERVGPRAGVVGAAVAG